MLVWNTVRAWCYELARFRRNVLDLCMLIPNSWVLQRVPHSLTNPVSKRSGLVADAVIEAEEQVLVVRQFFLPKGQSCPQFLASSVTKQQTWRICPSEVLFIRSRLGKLFNWYKPSGVGLEFLSDWYKHICKKCSHLKKEWKILFECFLESSLKMSTRFPSFYFKWRKLIITN